MKQNISELKPGETFCVICKRIIKIKNKDRHTYSKKHENELNKILKKVKPVINLN